jgi:hypothetical protein
MVLPPTENGLCTLCGEGLLCAKDVKDWEARFPQQRKASDGRAPKGGVPRTTKGHTSNTTESNTDSSHRTAKDEASQKKKIIHMLTKLAAEKLPPHDHSKLKTPHHLTEPPEPPSPSTDNDIDLPHHPPLNNEHVSLPTGVCPQPDIQFSVDNGFVQPPTQLPKATSSFPNESLMTIPEANEPLQHPSHPSRATPLLNPALRPVGASRVPLHPSSHLSSLISNVQVPALKETSQKPLLPHIESPRKVRAATNDVSEHHSPLPDIFDGQYQTVEIPSLFGGTPMSQPTR